MNKWILLMFFAGVFSGCSSVSVNRDFDDSVDFPTLKTFAWQHVEQPKTKDSRIDNDLNDERIRNAVNTMLAAKAFRSVDRADADFLVAYFVDYQRKLSSGSVSIGMGRGSYGRHGGVGYSSGISESDQLILTLDILDPVDGKMIWRGVGTRSVYEGSNSAKSIKNINGLVEKILKVFPPNPR